MASQTDYGSCLMRSLVILLIVLVVVFIGFFSVSALFNLGVWDEFWEMVSQRTGWNLN